MFTKSKKVVSFFDAFFWFAGYNLTMNVTLIGMAGAGKSLIGKALAKKLGYTFIDTDKIIGENIHLDLQDIIDIYGKDRFLKIEEDTILNLDVRDRCVVAPGGSVIYSKKAIAFLKKRSTVVFLDVPFGSIDTWIVDKVTRGIVGLKKKGLKTLYKERRPLYEKYADVTVKLKKGSVKQTIISNIIAGIAES